MSLVFRRLALLGALACSPLLGCESPATPSPEADPAPADTSAVAEPPTSTEAMMGLDEDPAPVAGLAEELVGEWSSRRRGDTGGETIIFARDGSVVLRDGNDILRNPSPVPSGGRLGYEVDERAEPVRLDFVVMNAGDEQVARIPGIVKILTDDQAQVCMDPATLNRPADFTGDDCVVLTQLGSPETAVRERVAVQEPSAQEAPGYAEPPASTPGERQTNRWFVIVGGARDADDPRIAERQQLLDRAGITDTYTVDSDAYPNLNPGLTALVIGPFSQADAQARLRGVRPVVPEAYIKSGW